MLERASDTAKHRGNVASLRNRVISVERRTFNVSFFVFERVTANPTCAERRAQHRKTRARVHLLVSLCSEVLLLKKAYVALSVFFASSRPPGKPLWRRMVLPLELVVIYLPVVILKFLIGLGRFFSCHI